MKAAALLLLCALLAQPIRAQSSASARPDLIVFIAVDQLRADYLDRWRDQLTGGFGRLLRGGAFFTNAFQDHAITETAPGHSTMLSGRFPRSTGIVANAYGVNDPASPLIGVKGSGASPFRFRGSVLMDWLRVRDPLSRGVSVSRKDRGAILPFGRAQQQVYWYADGQFTTSTYYADTLETWVRTFNTRTVPVRSAGRAWELLLPRTAYPEPDTVPYENQRGGGVSFPHVLSTDTTQAKADFINFPWMDQYTLDFALEALVREELGRRGHTDLLSVSLSSTDAVGHRFGPDSREIHDQVLRLDRSLGMFLDSLFRVVDSTRVVIALTADHAVSRYPEAVSPDGARMHVSLAPVADSVRAGIAARGVSKDDFVFEDGLLLVDRARLRDLGVNVDSVVDAFASRVRKVPGVASALRVRDLSRMDTIADPIARRWHHMIPRDLPIELVVTLEPQWYWGWSRSADHGSPYDTDAHVPILLFGAPIQPGRYGEFARTVDIAPTLAHIANARPAEQLDGHILVNALRTGWRPTQ